VAEAHQSISRASDTLHRGDLIPFHYSNPAWRERESLWEIDWLYKMKKCACRTSEMCLLSDISVSLPWPDYFARRSKSFSKLLSRILPSHFAATCSPYREIHVSCKLDGKICHPFCHPRKIVRPWQCLALLYWRDCCPTQVVWGFRSIFPAWWLAAHRAQVVWVCCSVQFEGDVLL